MFARQLNTYIKQRTTTKISVNLLMSKKYKFTDNSKLYFVSFAVVNWIDLFIREAYRNVLIDSIKHCQATKDLELYGWCLMTSHVHLIIGSRGNAMSNIMRDLKRHTSEELHKAIANNKVESRREWMLWLMERAAKKTNNAAKFQLWQPESHPIELATQKIAWQKLDYIHYNPVEAGFVRRTTDWKNSSAIDYAGGKGLLEVILLDLMIM
jgi:putative transposase